MLSSKYFVSALDIFWFKGHQKSSVFLSSTVINGVFFASFHSCLAVDGNNVSLTLVDFFVI